MSLTCARVSLLTGPVQTTDPIGADDSTLCLDLDIATLKAGDPVEIFWQGEWWYVAYFLSPSMFGDVFPSVPITDCLCV